MSDKVEWEIADQEPVRTCSGCTRLRSERDNWKAAYSEMRRRAEVPDSELQRIDDLEGDCASLQDDLRDARDEAGSARLAAEGAEVLRLEAVGERDHYITALRGALRVAKEPDVRERIREALGSE